jgi:hypothetical protein
MIVPVRLIRDITDQQSRHLPPDLLDLVSWIEWNLTADLRDRSDTYSGTIEVEGVEIDVTLKFSFSEPKRGKRPK